MKREDLPRLSDQEIEALSPGYVAIEGVAFGDEPVHTRRPALSAVVPARTRRRWDAIALQQLSQAATRLVEENDCLARQVSFAEQCADMWQRTAEIERERGTVGLTLHGTIVRIDQSPGATIDDDPEYRDRRYLVGAQ